MRRCVCVPVLVCVLGWCVCVLEASCPQVCVCRAGVVDCSSRGLISAQLPSSLPPHTTELLLHHNLLTALPAGLLTPLLSLRTLTLHHNPWSCDCAALELRAWLLQQGSDALIRNVSCSSPPGLQGRLLAYLSEEELLSGCRYRLCDLALVSQISLFVFIVIQAMLLAAVVHFLRRFDRLTCDARRSAREEGDSEGDTLLKDRHS